MTGEPAGYSLLLDARAPAAIIGLPITREMLWPDRLPAARLRTVRVRPNLAVVLGRPLSAGMSPGAVQLAVAGTCLVLEAVDESGRPAGLVTDDRLLEPGTDATLQLWACTGGGPGSGGRETGSTVPAAPQVRVEQLRQLADGVGEMYPGQLVLPVTDEADPPFTLGEGISELRGPGGAMLVLKVFP